MTLHTLCDRIAYILYRQCEMQGTRGYTHIQKLQSVSKLGGGGLCAVH